MKSDGETRPLISALCNYLQESEKQRHKVVDIFINEPITRKNGTIWMPGRYIGSSRYKEFRYVKAWEGIFN